MSMAPALSAALLLLTAIGLAPVGAAAAEPDGKALYQANCAKCHGSDGRANTPVSKSMKAPSLVDSAHAKGDVPGLTENIRAIDKHKPVTADLSPEELSAIARTVHDMAKPPKH